MHEMHIKAHYIKPWTKTTVSKNFSNRLRNILKRDFDPASPDAAWCTDITYIWTYDDGFVYLTSIMDLYSRKIISWVLSDTLETKWVVEAVNKAKRVRNADKPLIMHSDRGRQYTAKDYEEASQKAAEIMLDVIKNKPNANLGLATGSTPIRLYELMREDHKTNGTSYKDIKSFNLDEYYGLAQDHPQSYYYFMCHQLFNELDIDKNNINVPKGKGSIEEVCDEYNALLAENPRDIQLLGIGSNGHVGFNEPGTSFDSVTHYIALKQSTIEDNAKLFFNGDLSAVPTHAITMGISNIMEAKKVLLIATGERKAKAVKGLVEGPVTEDLPASILQKHEDAIIIVDEAAASLLSK